MAGMPKRAKEGKVTASKARQNAARKTLQEFATPIEGTTPEILFSTLLDQVYGQLAWVNTKVAEVPEAELFRDTIAGRVPNEWVLLQRDLMDRAFRYSHSALGINLRRRQVEVEEAQAAMVAFMLKAALEKAGLSTTQRRAVLSAVREVAEEQQALPQVTGT